MVKQITSSSSQVSVEPVDVKSVDVEPAGVEPVKDMKLEQARMTDVMFLLETLFVREESTVKQILDCLYDVGSVNLIDQRVQIRCLNRLAKWIARFSKPIFRIIALRWCKQNCPQLITNWLYTQVKFAPQQIAQIVEEAEEAEEAVIQPVPSPELDLYRQKVQLLHGRIRLLTTLLIGITVTLGSGLVWSLGRPQTQASQSNPFTHTRLMNQWEDKPESCTAHALQPCP